MSVCVTPASEGVERKSTKEEEGRGRRRRRDQGGGEDMEEEEKRRGRTRKRRRAQNQYTGSTAVGLITPMLCPVLVLAWALQVVVVPGQTRAVMGGDPERSRAIELIKGRILADLGLSSAPSGAPSEARGTLSKAHMDHMMRVYRRSVQRSVEPGPGERVRNDRKEFARGNEREVMHYYSFKNQGNFTEQSVVQGKWIFAVAEGRHVGLDNACAVVNSRAPLRYEGPAEQTDSIG
ncbi:hypothetical protein HPB47_007077, partial [Ixodes persulcatus]